MLKRILEVMKLDSLPAMARLDKFLLRLIDAQNLQSASCIKAIGTLLRNHKKPILEDDLRNPIVTYQTTFDFLRADIESYRRQGIRHQCFQVLHPWAYSLDTVDMTYIVNTDFVSPICQLLEQSFDAQVFWLSFFKPQLACPADEFVEALRQLCELNGMGYYFLAKDAELRRMVASLHFVISLEQHPEIVMEIVEELVGEALRVKGYSPLRDQFKVWQMDTSAKQFLEFESMASFTISPTPELQFFRMKAEASVLGKISFQDVIGLFVCDLQRRPAELEAQKIPAKRLVLRFEQVDSQELKGAEVIFEGDRAICKVGDGEASHYQIPNDKKLWETQFVVCSING